ncbi:MAG: glycosyltransferase family 4 protein [Chloroflexota bacterium]|nr:glycosyltransferase family 4 protein [Chloroflexota bacterium]
MKVLIVSSKYQPEYSGSGLRAHNTYLRLKKQYKIAFEVVCSSVEFTESKKYRYDGVTVTRLVSSVLRKIFHKVGNNPLRRVINAAIFYSEARSVTKLISEKDFDLIHVFGYSPATVAAINWSRNKDIPLILEIVNTNLNPYQYLPGARHFHSYDLSHKTVIVAISKHIAKLCESAKLTDNVWTRPNPVDTSRFKPTSHNQQTGSLFDNFGFDNTDKIIVYVAKFLKRKNHSFLIDVLKELPSNFKLVLAGPPLPRVHSVPGFTLDDITQLMRKAQSMEVDDRLILRPEFVDFAQYLKAADVTCFPSVREGMGTPLLESLAAGVPVVANADEASFREHIIDNYNGYLQPLDAKKWADAIIMTTKFGPDQRRQFSTEVISRYSTEKIDNHYFKLMNALVSSKANEPISVTNVLKR